MCNKQCGALPLKPTYAEVTDRINALGYVLGALNDSIGSLPFNNEHATAIDNARFAVADELQSLTKCKSQVKPQPPKAPTPPEARVIVEGKPQD